MAIPRRVHRALHVLRTEGVGGLVRATISFARRRLTPSGPDECSLVFAALDARSRPGTMVDVGAHVGSSLLPFAKAGWRVLALEPDRVNRELLLSETRGLPKVTIDSRAASDHEEEGVTFFRSDLSTGISGLSAFHPTHQASDRVTLSTLRTILQGHKIETVDFLKIDTEGFDLFVLRGVPWESVSPNVIVCEFEDAKTVPLGYSFHDMAALLVQQGYAVIVSEWYPIVQYGRDHSWRRFVEYPCELEDTRAWGNLIAVRDKETLPALVASFKRFSAGRSTVA